VYNSNPVGAKGGAVNGVVSAASGDTSKFLKQVFAPIL